VNKLDAEERSGEYDVACVAIEESLENRPPMSGAQTVSLTPALTRPGISQRAPALLKNATTWTIRKLLHGVKYFLPDYVYLLLLHRRLIGRFPNLKRPTAFNELILLRSLRPATQWIELADKLGVRDYVKHRVGERYLIPLVAVPDAFTEAVFDSLPSSFVMKANHGCGFVKVVWDKSQTSFAELNQIASQWLATNFYCASRERHYRCIKPRIFFEAVLLDETGNIPADLKLHVFGRKVGGPIVYTALISDRFGDIRCDVYDAEWNRMDLTVGEYRRSDAAAPRPANWAEVVRIAILLASDIGYVRVDLYSTGNDVYFGEFTFTPGAGAFRFNPDHYDYEWGYLLKETLDCFESAESVEGGP
jgi:hypothetical protein